MTAVAPERTEYEDGTIVASQRPRRLHGRRTVVLVIGAVVLLGVAGAVAAVSLTGSQSPGVGAVVVPSAGAAPTSDSTAVAAASAVGLPTAEVLGRNVFAPLADVPVAGNGTTEVLVDSPEAVVAPPAATVTVTAAGPTVTDMQIVTETQDPSTVTSTVTSTATSTLPYLVTVVSVADGAVADSNATFTVNGQSSTVAKNALFGGVFTYTGYNATSSLVSFTYGSTAVTATVGKTIALQ